MKTLFTALAGAMLLVLTASQATIAYYHLFLSEASICVNNDSGWTCYSQVVRPENAEKAARLMELYQQYPASKKKDADI